MDIEVAAVHRTKTTSTCSVHYWGKTSKTCTAATEVKVAARTRHSRRRWAASDACSLGTGGSWRSSARVKSHRVKFTINWATLPKTDKLARLEAWAWRRRWSARMRRALERDPVQNLIGGAEPRQPRRIEHYQNLLIWSFHKDYMHDWHRQCNLSKIANDQLNIEFLNQ